MIRWDGLALGTGCFLACCWGAGCGPGKPVEVSSPASYQNLKSISLAYFDATAKLGRPPGNLNDLMPFLKKQGDPAVLLRSPDDGKDYTILWGVDVRAAKPPYPVLAYEQEGKDGKRFVLEGRNVARVTNDEFKKAPFPPGHKAP
jgi:hypothetical protein